MSIITTYSGITEVSPEDLLIIADMSILGTPTRTVNAQMLVGGSTAPLALTTFGTSGDATLINNVLNVPNYGSGTMSSWFVYGDASFEVTDGEGVLFIGGTKLTASVQTSGQSVTFNHDATTRADTTSAVSPGAAGTFTVIDSITQDATGHPTAVNVKTVTMPTTGGGAGDTTYDLTSAQSGSDVNVNLVGSDATTDTVKFVAGTGITLTDSGSNQITVAGTEGTVTTISGGTSTFITNTVTNPTTTPVITSTLSATGTPGATTFLRGDNTWAVPAGGGGGTTYDLASAQDGANVDITLTPSTGAVDTVQLTAGTGITLADDGNNNITIISAASGTGLWTATGNDIYNNNSGAVVVGRTSLSDPGAILEIEGRVSLTDTTTNSVFIGRDAGESTTANNNVALGTQALSNNIVGQQNVAIGTNALLYTVEDSNTAVGHSAGSQITTGEFNTAIGASAMVSQTTGDSNTAIGASALRSMVTGTGNVAIGKNSMYLATGGDYNIAAGENSLKDNTTGDANTAIGYSSITENTTGNFNTALGYLSLDSNITGSSNVALGYTAGRSIKNSGGNNANANNSTYIGAQAKAGAANVTEEIVIGFQVEGNGSNTTTIGDMVSTQATYLGGDLILQSASLHRGGYAVGALPTGVVGARAYVVNGPINAAYRDIVSSGSTGSEILPIFYNGTNWIYA